MNEAVAQGAARGRHYGVDLKRYYRLPATQVSLTTVLSLLIVAFFVIVAIRPTLVTVATLKKSIETEEKTLKALRTKEKAVQRAATLYEELKSGTLYTDRAVPLTGAKYDDLAKTFEILASQAGVELTGVTVGESLLYSEILKPYEGRAREAVSVPVTVRVSGSYPLVRKFFNLVISIDRLIEIETLSVGRDSGGRGKEEGVALSLTGTAAYMADKATIAKILTQKEQK